MFLQTSSFSSEWEAHWQLPIILGTLKLSIIITYYKWIWYHPYPFSCPCQIPVANFQLLMHSSTFYSCSLWEVLFFFFFSFSTTLYGFGKFQRLLFQGLWKLCKLNYLTNMYFCLHNGWWRSCLSISTQSWQMSPRQCLFPNFALVSWQRLCWGHITICWAMCIASVVPSPWRTTTSTRLNDRTLIDTKIFTTIRTLVPNIFCTVCTKWNTTTSAKNKML